MLASASENTVVEFNDDFNSWVSVFRLGRAVWWKRPPANVQNFLRNIHCHENERTNELLERGTFLAFWEQQTWNAQRHTGTTAAATTTGALERIQLKITSPTPRVHQLSFYLIVFMSSYSSIDYRFHSISFPRTIDIFTTGAGRSGRRSDSCVCFLFLIGINCFQAETPVSLI